MVENGVQLTLTSTVKNNGKIRINGDGLNGSHLKDKHEGGSNGALQPSNGQPKQQQQQQQEYECTACSKGHTCQAVIGQTRQMRALITARKPHQAQAAFHRLADGGHRPSLVTFTTLLTALTCQRAFDAIPWLLAEVELAGHRPDSIFFNALINALVEAGRVGEATNTFLRMRHVGCLPTTSTFNTLIKGFGLASRPLDAQRLFDDMMASCERGEAVKPNATTHNILVKAWCDAGRMEEAWRAVARMRAAGVGPDVVTYNTLASAYAKRDETWRAEELVVVEMAGIRTSERTWGIIVGGYCREGRLGEAFRCVRQMKDAGVPPNVIVFNTLIKGFLDAGDMAAVDDVLRMMDEFGIKPDIVTYSHQLNALSSLGHMTRCIKVFDEMTEAGIEPDPQVYSILAKGYVRAQQPAKAEELLRHMARLGVRPNVVTFTTVISGWCSVADMGNAMRVFDEMRDAGVRPNLRTFETLIWGYSELKQPWKAEEVLQMMHDAGVRPKQTTFSLIADAWNAVGLVENANRALGDIVDDDEEPDRPVAIAIDGDSKLQSFERTNGHAKSSGLASMSLQAVRKSPEQRLLRRSCRIPVRWFCRKQLQMQYGMYGQGISSVKMVMNDLKYLHAHNHY
uniref:Pentacotripeptide-repeat region of PRORP domain-containing protein n=1 Tax=Leersia perrieri TaxID=77586 RepID=A0A0D9UYT6_9ORYZ